MISSSSYQIEQDLAIQQQPDFFLTLLETTNSICFQEETSKESKSICRKHSLVELAIFVIS